LSKRKVSTRTAVFKNSKKTMCVWDDFFFFFKKTYAQILAWKRLPGCSLWKFSLLMILWDNSPREVDQDDRSGAWLLLSWNYQKSKSSQKINSKFNFDS
jgi:hypothetical protein